MKVRKKWEIVYFWNNFSWHVECFMIVSSQDYMLSCMIERDFILIYIPFCVEYMFEDQDNMIFQNFILINSSFSLYGSWKIFKLYFNFFRWRWIWFMLICCPRDFQSKIVEFYTLIYFISYFKKMFSIFIYETHY